jgi:hypothetical protein
MPMVGLRNSSPGVLNGTNRLFLVGVTGSLENWLRSGVMPRGVIPGRRNGSGDEPTSSRENASSYGWDEGPVVCAGVINVGG